MRKPPSDKKTHYVDKKQLLAAMSEHRSRVISARGDGPAPRASDYIGSCIIKICNGLSMDHHFVRYTQHWKEEMVFDAIENCCAAINNFDPAKSNNAFGYFTQIAFNAFLRRIDKERKQQYVKHKNFERSGLRDELVHELGGGRAAPQPHNEVSSGIVEAYEATMARRAQKKSEKSDEEGTERAPGPRGRFGRGRKAAQPGAAPVEREGDLPDEG